MKDIATNLGDGRTVDVVNETLADSGGGFRNNSVWNNKIGGQATMDHAFTEARKAMPNAKLFYNDYNTEDPRNPKSEAQYKMIKGMVDRGIPIDGVGFQMHLSAEQFKSNPGLGAAIQKNLQRYRDLGLNVQITEMDVKNGSQSEKAAIIHDVFKAAAGAKADGLTFWGNKDGSTWLPNTGGPFDSSGKLKSEWLQAFT
jgi:endo-1,4-beta-xylanase